MFHEKVNRLIRHVLRYRIKYDLSLYVYSGYADQSELQSVRQQVPKWNILFYIILPAPGLVNVDIQLFSQPENLLISSNFDGAGQIISDLQLLVNCLRFRKLIIAESPGLSTADMQKVQSLRTQGEKILRIMYHEKMCRLNSFRSSLLNLNSVVSPHSLKIPHLGPEYPAIICSAGPSLMKQLGWLKKHQSQLWILTVGRIFPVLLRHGVRVDAVIEIDSVAHLNWPRQLPESNAVLVAPFSVSPVVAAKFERVIWFSGESVYFNRLLRSFNQEILSLEFSACVTTAAVDFAVKAGIRKTALIGNDFCLGQQGQSHTGGIQLNVGENEMLEIAGNDSGKVTSVGGLVKLKEGFEQFLLSARERFEDNGVEIFNATSGGARIQHTTRMDLDDFIRKYGSPISKPAEGIQAEGAGLSCGSMEEHRKRLGMFMQNREEILTFEERVLGDLRLRRDDLKRNNLKILDFLLRNEQKQLADPLIHAISSCAADFCEEITLESSLPNGPVKMEEQYRELSVTKAKLNNGLTTDLAASLDAVATGDNAITHPLQFSSFRSFSIDIIRRQNNKYAELLDNNRLKPVAPFQFRVSPRSGRFLPFASILRPEAGEIPLNSSNETMEKDAKKEIMSFLGVTRFDVAKHGVMFFAPGNWLHVVAFAEEFPEAAVLVVDPWPELFSELISYSMFLHTLPENSVVTAIHPELTNTDAICESVLDRWQQQGRTPLVFRHPVTWQLEAIKACYHSRSFVERLHLS